MADISFGSRIKTIFDLIISQSFFITLFAIVLATIIILIINFKVKSKAPRIVAIIVYLGMTILALLRYGNYVKTLNDSIVEKVFRAVYFPNFAVYVCMLIISMLLIFITFIDRKFSIIARVGNICCFFLIWFFFVLILDTVKKAGLNFYETAQLYSNSTVMILLQSSMFVFVTWMAIFLLDYVVRKLSNKMDEKERQKISVNKN